MDKFTINHMYEVNALYDRIYSRPNSHKLSEVENYVEVIVDHYTRLGVLPKTLKILELLAGIGRHRDYLTEALSYAFPGVSISYFSIEGIEENTDKPSHIEKVVGDNDFDIVVAFFYSLNSILDMQTMKTSYSATRDLFVSAHRCLKKGGIALLDVSIDTNLSDTLEEVFDNDVEHFDEVPFSSDLHFYLKADPTDKLILRYNTVSSYDRLAGRLSTNHFDILVYNIPINIERDDYWEPWCAQHDISDYCIAEFEIINPFTLQYYTEGALVGILQNTNIPLADINFLDMQTETIQFREQPMVFNALGLDADGDEIEDSREYEDFVPTCVKLTKNG